MGNSCLGKKKPKTKIPTQQQNPKKKKNKPHQKESPNQQQAKQQSSNSDPTAKYPNDVNSNTNRPGSPIPTKLMGGKNEPPDSRVGLPLEDQKTNLPPSERDLLKRDLPDYSFMKIAKTGGNHFSFEVYGQEISQLNPVFLRENLGNISQTSKFNISRNDLLLLTEENIEIRRFLEANNLNMHDIRGGMDDVPRLLNSGDPVLIQPLGQLGGKEEFGLPEHVKLKYLKLVNQNVEGGSISVINPNNISINQQSDNPNKNLIKEEDWKQDLNHEEDQMKFLQRQQRMFMNLDIWNYKDHEIVFRDFSKSANQDYNDEMLNSLKLQKRKISPFNFLTSVSTNRRRLQAFVKDRKKRLKTLKKDDKHVIMKEKPKVEDLLPGGYILENQMMPSNFLTALACLINSDIQFQTNSLRRLIYPHLNQVPSYSPPDVYLVKLFVNGIRRSVPLDGQFDPGLFLTRKNEIFPRLLEKGLQKIYRQQNLHEVMPNHLLYRLVGWIPEVLHFADIGNCEQSFEKLKESFVSFSVMLSFDYRGQVLPILEFVEDQGSNVRKIKTMMPEEADKFEHLNKDMFSGDQENDMNINSVSEFGNSNLKNQKGCVKEMSWDDLYKGDELENIYISWNPSIHHYRKSLHFTISPEPISSESLFDNSLFNNYKKMQVLISLSPHSEPNETRIILEKHRADKNGVQYEIRYNLYAFNRHRVSLPTECFKTLEVREDQEADVINDTMIFEQNSVQDNYILTIEAIPLAHLGSVFSSAKVDLSHSALVDADDQLPVYEYYNADDPLTKKKPKSGKDFVDCDVDELGVTEHFPEPVVMSLSIFAYYETEILEIPFKEVTQVFHMLIGGVQNQKFKLKMLESCDLEIRVEGGIESQFAIKVSKFSRYRNSYRDAAMGSMSQTRNVYLAQNQKSRRKANNLRFRAKEGTFLVLFEEKIAKTTVASKTRSDRIMEYLYGDNRNEVSYATKKKRIKISVIAYGKKLHRNYKESVSSIKNSPMYKQKTTQYQIESRFLEKERFKFDVPSTGGLRFKKVLKDEWRSDNNFGDNKFGIQTFQKFHQNPGFIVTVKEDTQINITAVVENHKDQFIGFKLNIFEIQDNYDLENILDYDDFVKEKKLVTDVLFLSKNKNGYLFLMVALHNSFRSPFTLTIQSDHELATVKDNANGICKLPWLESFTGSVESRCGGWVKMHNFLFNQSFIIILGDVEDPKDGGREEELFLELCSENSTQHIGVSVISLKHLKSLCVLDEQEMDSVSTNPAFLAETNTFYLRLNRGVYMIVPTTFEPLEYPDRLDYTLKIYGSIGFKFKQMPAFPPMSHRVQALTMVDQIVFSLESFTTTNDLMIVLESIDNDPDSYQVLEFLVEFENESQENFRKSVNLEKDGFFHKVFSIEAPQRMTLACASKIEKWLKLNLHIYSTQKDSFSLSLVRD